MIAGERYGIAATTVDRPANHGKTWTVEDYANLIRMYMRGQSSGPIAEAVGRTPKVTVSMLANLGLVSPRHSDPYIYQRSELKCSWDFAGISTATGTYKTVPLEDYTRLSRYFVNGMPVSIIASRLAISVHSIMHSLQLLGYVWADEAVWKLSYPASAPSAVRVAVKPTAPTTYADCVFKPENVSNIVTVQGSDIETASPLPTIEEDTMIAIENRTYINDTNAADMTDDQVFTKIADLERDMAKLEAIKNKPQKMVKRIGEMQDAITKLVKYVDERP